MGNIFFVATDFSSTFFCFVCFLEGVKQVLFFAVFVSRVSKPLAKSLLFLLGRID